MDGQINFKAYFDYKDAANGVDDLTKKFEAAGMNLNDAFNLGRSFDGSKQALKSYIHDVEATLESMKQQIRDVSEGIASDKALQKSLEQQLEAAAETAKQAWDIALGEWSKTTKAQDKAYGGIGNKLTEAEEKLKALKKQYDEMTEAFKTQDPSTIEDDSIEYYNDLQKAIAAAEGEVAALTQKYEEAKQAFNEQGGGNDFLESTRDAAKEADATVADLKRQLEDLKNKLAGSGNSESDLKNLQDEAQKLDAKLKGLKTRLKDPDMATGNIFNGLTQALQGVMGAYTAASGVMAKFGADEKDLQRIQTNLQASMSILMGLQQVYNALQTESAFRTQVLDKVMLAMSKTYQKVAASSALAKVGAVSLVVAIIAAVAALDRQHHQQALAQRRAERIHRTDRALRELLAQPAT